MSFKVGDAVTVKYTAVLSGTVESAAFVDGTNVVYLVSYTDQFGNAQQRYFSADELQAG